ncbi:MAG: UspA domain protein [Desulfacinum sp.]|jgi:nucleotide-binding universal stress UspA family protein|nr:UspA domain protein [Desulfacinum sp.]
MSGTVLVAVDASKQSLNAAALAARLMSRQRDQRVVLVHCLSQELLSAMQKAVSSGVIEWQEIEKRQVRMAEELLEKAQKFFEDLGVDRDRVELSVQTDGESPARTLVRMAENLGCHSLFLGRRGLSPMRRLLLGSTSDKVAQYAVGRTVWVVDAPLEEPREVLVAVDYREESEAIIDYTARFLAPVPGLRYTFLHLIPQIPPALWDDGRILSSHEREERLVKVERWIEECRRAVDGYFEKARALLKEKGVPDDHVKTLARPIREGIARDIVRWIREKQVDVAVLGKKSLGKGKPFLLGSHANKILHHAGGAALCLVGHMPEEG